MWSIKLLYFNLKAEPPWYWWFLNQLSNVRILSTNVVTFCCKNSYQILMKLGIQFLYFCQITWCCTCWGHFFLRGWRHERLLLFQSRRSGQINGWLLVELGGPFCKEGLVCQKRNFWHRDLWLETIQIENVRNEMKPQSWEK